MALSYILLDVIDQQTGILAILLLVGAIIMDLVYIIKIFLRFMKTVSENN